MYYFVSTATASTSITPRKWQKGKAGEERLAEWTSKKKSS
jgi:hypothetical protein